MGHNSVVLGHPKSTKILWIDGLSTGPLDLGCHINSILVSLDLSYLEQLLFNSFLDLMISHIYVLRHCMIHSVLA